MARHLLMCTTSLRQNCGCTARVHLNEREKHQDPWSKGSQAGSNVPETTKSKLLAHLRKANDA